MIKLNKNASSYIDYTELLALLDRLKAGEIESAFIELCQMVEKIVQKKYYVKIKNSADLEELLQEVNLRIFKRLSVLTENTTSAGGFYQYVSNIAHNCFVSTRIKLNKELLIDEGQTNNVFDKLVSDEGNIEAKIRELSDEYELLNDCTRALFRLNSKPYIILSFCFNVMVYGVEAGMAQRSRASHTAFLIAQKQLGGLRNEFCVYYERNYRSLDSEIIQPLDDKLAAPDGTLIYALQKMCRYYGANPAKSIADWTNVTRKALLKALAAKKISAFA